MAAEQQIPLHNEKCLLLKFKLDELDEDGEVQHEVAVGFAPWLVDPDPDTPFVELKKLRNKQVKVKWPNTDVVEAAQMNRSLSKKGARVEWIEHEAELLYNGAWADCHSRMDTWLNCGDIEMSREDRRLYSRKKPGFNSDCEGESQSTRQRPPSPDDELSSEPAEQQQNSNNAGRKTTGRNQNRFAPQVRRKKRAPDVEKPTSSMVNVLAGLERSPRAGSLHLTDSSEDEEPMNNWSKDKLLSMLKMSREEEKRLRRDNSRLRTLRQVSKDLPMIKEVLQSTVRAAEKAKNEVRSMREEVRDFKNQFKKVMEELREDSRRARQQHNEQPIARHLATPRVEPIANVTPRRPRADQQQMQQQQQDDRENQEENDVLAQPIADDVPGEDPPAARQPLQAVVDNTPARQLRANEHAFGDIILTDAQLANLGKHPVSNLMAKVFTIEELQNCSVSGGETHFKGKRSIGKPALNPAKRLAVHDYCVNVLNMDQGKVKDKMKKKCNNESTGVAKKARQAVADAAAADLAANHLGNNDAA